MDLKGAIYTIGYGNRGFEAFIKSVKSFQITHLVDVRSIPQSSYWKDFGRENLDRTIPLSDLKYVYMGDTLGAHQPEGGDFPKVEGIHPQTHNPNFRRGLTALVKAMRVPDRRICLMCGCMRPHACHRSSLVGEALVAEGVEVLHIDAADQTETQAEVMLAIAGLQSSLF